MEKTKVKWQKKISNPKTRWNKEEDVDRCSIIRHRRDDATPGSMVI